MWWNKVNEPNQRRRNSLKENEWIGNNIGVEGARLLSESLKSNSTLTRLNLFGDEISENN